MATGYSQDQLDLMDDVLEALAPKVPGPEDRKCAYTVSAMKVVGTDVGVLLNLGFRKGKSLLIMLNCVVSRELIISLTLGSLVHGWHLRGAGVACADHLQNPSPDHLSTAKQVTGVSSYTMPDGMMLRAFMPDEDQGEVITMFLPAKVAVQLALAISLSGDRAQWWTPEYELIPARESQN